jgi:type VI secretion system protein ImpH
MRSERWWQETSVTEALFAEPTAFEFVQTTRILRHVPYAKNLKYWADDFHFATSLNLNFPNSEIESLKIEDEKVALKNLVVGLMGIQGALPYTYTSKVRHAPRKQREDVEKFIGLFNHKLTAQYVDASLAYNLPVRYEIEEENHYLNILHALNGYVSSQHQQKELDDYFAEFAGLMQGQNNTAHALRTMLTCVFKQNIHVEEFIQEKFKLDDSQKTSLGGNNPSLLGVNTFCGETIRQIDGKIEIQIGPLNHEQYLEYLPNMKQSTKLKSILKSWCSPTLLVDLRLILSKDSVKPICLSSTAMTGLSQGAFLMPKSNEDSYETHYALLGVA